MTDLILAIAHHLLVFSLAGIIGAELVLLRPGLSRERLALIGRIDLSYGAVAGLILIVGFSRVYFGLKGPDAYLGNWVFQAKLGAFLVVGLLSIPPTISILRWRRAARSDAQFAVPEAGSARSRTFLWGEAVVFALIPVFAAAMARGYGL